MTDLERVQALLENPGVLVYIQTDEEHHALELLRVAAVRLGCPLRQWDVITGTRDGLVDGAAPESGTDHPAAALVRFTQYADNSILVLLDVAGHLGDERTLRALREAVEFAALRHDLGLRLVLIDHKPDLPQVIRNAGHHFEVTPPDDEEVERLIKSTIRRIHRLRPIEASMSARELSDVVRNLRGLSRRQIQQIIAEVANDDQRFNAKDLPRILARKRDFVQTDGLLEFVQAPTSMDEIGGLDRLKTWLAQRQNALSNEAVEFGIEAPRGVLLLGVQGAGKSLCAKAIATAWKRPLMRLDPSVLYDRYIGESERRLRDALRQAEVMSPVVLWMDEIEKGFASAASRSIDGGLSQRMFGTLLSWMQEHRHPVFLAATANDIEALPPELLRKGRFDEIFFVDLPGEAARRSIVEIHIRKRRRDAARFDLARLAAVSAGYSGAEIEQAVAAALHTAFAGKSEINTAMIERCLLASPPLSVMMRERIEALRSWAAGRCVPAE
ncbi:MAG: AAA family ATPase [Phycisphaeraceae bacterium]|nr:AAA family ATPase [Phycisphaeraceae bacterium]